VWAKMRELGLVLPALFERDPDAPRGQVATAESNRRWATNLTTVWTKRDGLVAVIPVIDCGDRVLLDCALTKSQESAALLAPVERALRREFGTGASVPDGLELRTDHRPQYTGSDCGDLCAAWNLDHTLAPVGRPTGNAVAERVIQTLKVELVWTRNLETIDELREAVTAWMHQYNHVRPRQEFSSPSAGQALLGDAGQNLQPVQLFVAQGQVLRHATSVARNLTPLLWRNRTSLYRSYILASDNVVYVVLGGLPLR
jgi:transposase InsO family protein